MIFTNKPPKWDEAGVEPSAELQTKGFTAGYKPPAAYFNFLFNKITACLKELQAGLSNVDNTADKDKPISTAQQTALCDLEISGEGAGNIVSVTDSASAPFNSLKMYGTSKQQTTTGKNLFNTNLEKGLWAFTTKEKTIDENYVMTADFLTVEPNTTYALSGSFMSNFRGNLAFYDKNKTYIDQIFSFKTFTTPDNTHYILFHVAMADVKNISGTVQMERGNTATEYEPYTGGMAAPNPDFPQDINSVGDNGVITITSCGKNILKPLTKTQTFNGITFTPNSDGTIAVTGTSTSSAALVIDYKRAILGRYIISGSTTNTRVVARLIYKDGTDGYFTSYNGSIVEFEITENVKEYNVYVEVKGNITVDDEIIHPMLRTVGNETYEPYNEFVATIPMREPLRSVGEVKDEISTNGIIRKFASVTFDGSADEGWNRDYSVDTTKMRMVTGLLKDVIKKTENYDIANIWCTMFSKARANDTYSLLERISVDDIGRVHIYSDKFNDAVENWTTFLSQNPMTVIYELAEPVTEELTTEQQKAICGLQSHKGVTNIFSNGTGELAVSYYKDTTNGKAVGNLTGEIRAVRVMIGDISTALDNIIGGA